MDEVSSVMEVVDMYPEATFVGNFILNLIVNLIYIVQMLVATLESIL